MEAHITTSFADSNPLITHFVWSDGAWVSFNADTKEWAHHGTIPHPTANPSKFGGAKPEHSRRATDALEVVPLADAPRPYTQEQYVTAEFGGITYRVRNGMLEGRERDGTWFVSGRDADHLSHIPEAAPLIAALTAEPPRHSAECADAE
jgi:hypothetical protein